MRLIIIHVPTTHIQTVIVSRTVKNNQARRKQIVICRKWECIELYFYVTKYLALRVRELNVKNNWKRI